MNLLKEILAFIVSIPLLIILGVLAISSMLYDKIMGDVEGEI